MSKAETSGDPKVEAAFQLGWHVGEMAHMLPDAGHLKVPGYLLDQVPNLGAAKRTGLLIAQITEERRVLGLPTIPARPASDVAKGASLSPPIISADGRVDRAWVDALHGNQLDALMGIDYRLGKSYLLGAGLAETAVVGYKIAASKDEVSFPPADLALLFADERVGQQVGQLRDLKTSFQAYAADACETTLREWALWIRERASAARGDDPTDAAPGASVANRLYYQGQVWRGLLSGEKEAQDALTIGMYLGAVEDIASKYLRLFWRWFRNPLVLVAAIALLIVLILLLVLQNLGVVHDAVSEVVLLLGVFGVSTAGLTAALKRGADQAGQHLWQAELAAAISEAINKCPGIPSTSPVRALRRGI